METWNYAYDDLNRLLLATNFDTPSLTQSFTYDDIGNITYNSQIGTYSYTGTPHAVATAGSRSYQYDAAGRMTSRNGTVIQWNGDGKPSSIGNVGFTYGGLGERLKKVSGGQTTRYVGGNYEIAHDGTVTKYLLGGKQVGTNFFVHHRDHLGSIQAITDAAGVEVRRQNHTPFGDQHYASGSHTESKGWIGEREEETELVYLNARYFDPEIGRFISPDPIMRLGQRLNRYTYSVNSPMNFLDPTGLSCAVSHGITMGEGNSQIVLRGPVSLGCDHSGTNRGAAAEEKAGNILDKLAEQEARREERERRRAEGELGPQQQGGGTGTGTGLGTSTGTGTTTGTGGSTGTSDGSTAPQANPSGSTNQQSGGFWSGILGVLGRVWNAPNSAIGFL